MQRKISLLLRRVNHLRRIQLEKTRRTLSKEDFDMLPTKEKGKGLKRPTEPKKLPPSKKKKKKEKKDKPYNAGKKAGR